MSTTAEAPHLPAVVAIAVVVFAGSIALHESAHALTGWLLAGGISAVAFVAVLGPGLALG